ncbi:hypothetical protein BGW80DRAFT_1321644 [Lactifluus volemus]|nr:hypothetical protein BGW80DRAFT_1321644 [Lactifluus volemus]
MTSVVKGMDKAMETMNLERISLVMDKLKAQFSDLDVQTSYMEDAMGSTTAVSTPQDQVDPLMRQMAEEANIELQQDLADKEVPSDRRGGQHARRSVARAAACHVGHRLCAVVHQC